LSALKGCGVDIKKTIASKFSNAAKEENLENF